MDSMLMVDFIKYSYRVVHQVVAL